jgi:hypothetical protein
MAGALVEAKCPKCGFRVQVSATEQKQIDPASRMRGQSRLVTLSEFEAGLVEGSPVYSLIVERAPWALAKTGSTEGRDYSAHVSLDTPDPRSIPQPAESAPPVQESSDSAGDDEPKRDRRPHPGKKSPPPSRIRPGAGHSTKTLPKVAVEMALSVLAYNLTRVMNIVGIKPLVAAIAA